MVAFGSDFRDVTVGFELLVVLRLLEAVLEGVLEGVPAPARVSARALALVLARPPAAVRTLVFEDVSEGASAGVLLEEVADVRPFALFSSKAERLEVLRRRGCPEEARFRGAFLGSFVPVPSSCRKLFSLRNASKSKSEGNVSPVSTDSSVIFSCFLRSIPQKRFKGAIQKTFYRKAPACARNDHPLSSHRAYVPLCHPCKPRRGAAGTEG
jgi:hypothetical protein